jgi:hypothetical protein
LKPAHPQLGGGATRCGLLWWLEPRSSEVSWDAALVERWKKAGGSERLLAVGAELAGRKFATVDDARTALRAAITKVTTAKGGAADLGWFDPEVDRLAVPFWNEVPGPVVAYRADGYLGNSLVVVPERRLVAVRQRRYPRDERETSNSQYDFAEFPALARALVASRSP